MSSSGLMPSGASQREKFCAMLLREQFGRSHQRGLAVGFDGVRRRECRDDRLAGTDVALHEPEHRVRDCEIAANLARSRAAAHRSAKIP